MYIAETATRGHFSCTDECLLAPTRKSESVSHEPVFSINVPRLALFVWGSTKQWPLLFTLFNRKRSTDVLLDFRTVFKNQKTKQSKKKTNTQLNTQDVLQVSVPFFSAEGVYHETYLKSLCPSAAHCILDPHLNKQQQFATTCNGGRPIKAQKGEPRVCPYA